MRLARWRRPLAVIGLGLVLATPAAVDHLVARPSAAVERATRAINPSATASSAGASTWFCASGRTSADGTADLTITVANPTDAEVPGRITWFAGGSGRDPVVEPLLAAAHSHMEMAAPDQIAGGPIAALAEFDGGGIAVDHRISGPLGGAIAPCSSSANAQWFTADGATTIDAKTTLSIFNPFPEDALLDIRFVTDRGSAVPAALQGVSVAARSVYDLNVGDFVRRRSRVAAIVRARIGRVVVERTTTFDGSGTSKGTTVSPASSEASPTWYFASGRSTPVVRERYTLFNPTRSPLTAIIDVVVDGVAGVEPFEIDVPSLGSAELDPFSEPRIPRDVGYSVVVTTENGAGIVVERTVDARGRLRRGFSSSPGIVAPAESWVVPDVVASSGRSDVISLLNPTDTDAVISLKSLGQDGAENVAAARSVSVVAAGRLDIRLGDYVALDQQSLLVLSPGAPIVVERSAQLVERVGNRPLVDPLPSPGRDDSLRALTVETLPGEPSTTTAAAPPSSTVAPPSSTVAAPPSSLSVSTTVVTSIAPSSSATSPTTSASTTTAVEPATTPPTTVSSTSTAPPALPGTARQQAVVSRIGTAKIGTSVNGAIPLP